MQDPTKPSKLQTLKACRHQIIAASVATLGSFGTGTVFGWSAVATDGVKNYFNNVTDDMITWVTSLAILGAFLGGPLAGYTMDSLGRKSAIFIFSPPFFLGWMTMYSSYFLKRNGFFLLYIGRFLTGACAGSYLVIIPTYIKEASSDEMRGILGAAVPLLLVSGILYTFIIGAFCEWFITTICCGIPPVCLVIGTLFIPETPRYLVKKNKMTKAVSSVKWLNSIDSDEVAQEKLTQILSAEGIDVKKSSNSKSCRGLFSRPVVVPIVIIVFVLFFQQFGGVNAVTLYTNLIFEEAGENILEPRFAIIIIGIVQVVFVIVSMFLVDVLGRRTLLVWGSFIMGVSLAGLGTFFHLKEKDDGSEKSFGWLPIVTICTFLAGYSIGTGPIPWVLAAEIYNPEYRAESATVMTSSYWIFGFIVAKMYEDLRHIFKDSGSFWFYGGFCFAGSLFSALFVPETKGKSSEDILRHFGGIPTESESYQNIEGDAAGYDTSDIQSEAILIPSAIDEDAGNSQPEMQSSEALDNTDANN